MKKGFLPFFVDWGIPPDPKFLTFFGAKKEAKKHPPPPNLPLYWEA